MMTTNANSMHSLLRDIGRVNCSADVRRRTYQLLYASNRGLHDACVNATKFQIFPYGGQPPTPSQIKDLVGSTACCLLLTGVVLARFPECDVEFFSVRSAAEALLRIKSDVDSGRAVPSTAQFSELYAINRVANLLQENATLVDVAMERGTPPIAVTELTRMMNPVKIARGVSLAANMTIVPATRPSIPSPTTTPLPPQSPTSSPSDRPITSATIEAAYSSIQSVSMICITLALIP
ncbi:hypothetical protein P43SY_008529 [Pythium insidiosum]|uniref:Uncharacterized protein n=1 Tax=Pythium insidiosum TaxID=114742 RepID=A0AAD5QCY5_PYTIN|nr:hypothetical protein P43SY_008529 [Pythium insidiosum]